MLERVSLIKIPDNFKKEFTQQAYKENLFRLMILAGCLSVVELLVAVFVEDYKTDTFFLSLSLSVLCFIFFPIMLFTYKKIKELPMGWIKLIQTVFIVALILSGMFWSLFEQITFASSNTFILSIFALSALISIPPFKGAILFLAAYLLFFILLPWYQFNPDIVMTLRINAFCMSMLAGVLNRIVFRSQLLTFTQNKTIEQKNRELEEKNLVLTEMSMRDSMTSLLNHKNSIKRLREEVERAKRIDYPLSVAMLDLDNFKMINDIHGHLIGDGVLTQVAVILKDSCRSTDVIGRYGGEEFIIIMPDTNIRDAALLIKRVQANIKEAQFVKGVQVTLSCGISQLKGESAHGLIRNSDLMLYRAKKRGKDRVEINSIGDKKVQQSISF